MSLAGKTMFISGASRGIGKAMVDLFATDANNQILALSRNVEKMNTVFSKYDNVKCHALDLNAKDVRSKCTAMQSATNLEDKTAQHYHQIFTTGRIRY